jgi:hypothetical protein
MNRFIHLLGLSLVPVVGHADGLPPSLTADFNDRIRPLIEKNCGKCHGKNPKDNDLSLTNLSSANAMLANPSVLEEIRGRVTDNDMPPKKAPQPSLEEKESLIAWINSLQDHAASARSGDPGPVTLRRLTNAELDNAIRDLTGIDQHLTLAHEFPPDSVGGEGFANVGEAMPVTPELINRYIKVARDVASRAVLLPSGFRFSSSPDRPQWTSQAEKALRDFHTRHTGPGGKPPLEKHIEATIRHRDRLRSGGVAALASVATEEHLNLTYLTALWSGLNHTPHSATPDPELGSAWMDQVLELEADWQRRKSAFQAGKQKIDSGWVKAKRVLTESAVENAASVPFEQKVTLRKGETLVLSVLPNKTISADSTLIEWSIRETSGAQRTWSVTDFIPDLLRSNPRQEEGGAQWSFLEIAKAPTFLTQKREANRGRSEIKSWSIGAEPSVFVNASPNPITVWTTLPARSVFVHPGPARPVGIAWTSPSDAEVLCSGRVADVHPGDPDGVSFELAHIADPEIGPALANLGTDQSPPDTDPPPATLALVQQTWQTASDHKSVVKAINTLQDKLFWSTYNKFKVLAVGNGFPAWEESLKVVPIEKAETAAREARFRLITLQVEPAQPETFVIWDNLRLEGAAKPPLSLAEHPELRAAIEAGGHRFGHHPLGRSVPPNALVVKAPSELVIDLSKLPAPLLESLALPRFLRADASLDAGSPENATVQAFLLGQSSGPMRDPARCRPASWRDGDPLLLHRPDPRVAQLVHPKVLAQRADQAAAFRALFPPAALFEPIVPRDAQGSLFMFHREDEPLRRLLLDEAGRSELDRLWDELHFVSDDAFANETMYDGLLHYYHQPSEPPLMFFYIETVGDRVRAEKAQLLAAKAAAEPIHLEQLRTFASKAWRRPLTPDEHQDLLGAYHSDRSQGMDHDPALRAALARVLSSPWFLYRAEQPAPSDHWQPVSGRELATRLSFLVWDSIPDDELQRVADRLHEPAILQAQLDRMLRDSRVSGMAEEFGARWLGVRDFVSNHGRSLKDFPEFTSKLRDALAEEPVRFFEDAFRNDRPVSELITSDAAVLNDVVAAFYGIPNVVGSHWQRIENVASFGRGGLLGFGAVLAKQSAAARTSPIKRGAWLAHLIGDRLPKPPATVPPLPETPPDGLTVRELTERHRDDANCASCHVRIDPYGFPFERFNAIGKLRPANEMKASESASTLRDGTSMKDFGDIRHYIADKRREDLLRALARKLTGYALGRAILPSDRALIEEVGRSMIAGGRWSDALGVLVRSDQFRCIRPSSATAAKAP